MIFEMVLPDGGRIAGPVGRQHFDTFLDASYRDREGVKVPLDGVGKYNRADRLQKIESVEHVTRLDPLDFPSQLEELRVLKDGWYDGKGQAPPSAGLDWLAEAVNERYADSLPLPYVYPVAEGGVRLEWTLGPNEISLEIDPRGRAGERHSINLKTDDEEVRSLELDTREDWDRVVGRLLDSEGPLDDQDNVITPANPPFLHQTRPYYFASVPPDPEGRAEALGR